LENLVLTLAVFTLVGMSLPTLIFCWRMVQNPAIRARLRKPRLVVLGTLLAVIVVSVLFFPIGHTVEGQAVLVPADARAVYATVAGELTDMVPPGTKVQAGDVIAELRNPQVELAVAKHTGEFVVKQAHFQQLNTLRALESRLSLQLPTAQADLKDAQTQLAQYRRRAEDLLVRAPVAGVVIAAPDQQQKTQTDRLPTWSGSPLNRRNHGCWIEPGTIICTVGNPTKLAALVTIDERDVAEVQPGEAVEILLNSAPVQIFSGKVKQVASRAMEPSKDEPQIAAARRHVVEVELDAESTSALVGMGGTAKIEARTQTLAGLAGDFVKRRLRLPW
jgi:putative peptide zinc metalloprotease protein